MEKTTEMNEFKGNDNYGKPKQAYLDKLKEMDDKQLFDEAEQKIWLSAYANNNPRSDYHWHVDAIYQECVDRKNTDLYSKAYDAAKASI